MSFRRSSHLLFSALVRRTGVLVALITFLATGQTFGQGITTGSITGTVQDPQGRVIAGAKVVAVQNGTNTAYTAHTNSVGAFEIRGLAVGSYTVTIESAGFSRTQVNDGASNASRATSIGAQTLSVSAAAESVTVEAAAPILQTDTMQIGQTFETKKLADLPMGNGFDVFALFTPICRRAPEHYI